MIVYGLYFGKLDIIVFKTKEEALKARSRFISNPDIIEIEIQESFDDWFRNRTLAKLDAEEKEILSLRPPRM